MAERLLLVFLKAPRPGQVKLRLAQAVGAEAAAGVSRLLAERVLRQTRPRGPAYGRLVFYSPADAAAEIERWLPGETLLPQEGEDLGGRMDAAFGLAFGRAGRAALVGTDVPALSRRHVREALDALDRADVVLGPALDGGYYLIALSRRQPRLFHDIPWGTAAVREATLTRARDLGLAVGLLEPLRDVDTGEDLRAEWPAAWPGKLDPTRHNG